MQRSESAREAGKKAQERYKASDHGKEHIKSYYLSPEYRQKANVYQREYQKRPEVKLKLALKSVTYRARNKFKQKARQVTRWALESGKIIKPPCCDWCGEPAPPEQLETHHWRGYDPEYWLDVKFVHADPCHLQCEKVLPENWP